MSSDRPDLPDSFERLSHSDLIGAMRDLLGAFAHLQLKHGELSGAFAQLQSKHDELSGAFTKLRIEHQAVKDELARYKKLPPRPPQKPSGMEKATDRAGVGAEQRKGERSRRRRGGNLDKLKIDRTVVVKADAPAGSRFKGFEDIVIQDVAFHPLVTRYRRERWLTPDGHTVIAPLDPGLVGGYGPHLHRLILMLHFLRADELRANCRAAERRRRGDLQAPGGAAVDGQTREVPRRGRAGLDCGSQRLAVRHR